MSGRELFYFLTQTSVCLIWESWCMWWSGEYRGWEKVWMRVSSFSMPRSLHQINYWDGERESASH